MSGFWESELGEVTGKADDAFAKTFKQIPDGTMAMASIDNFMNAEYNGSTYLSIDWLLVDGDFKGQKVNQKIRVFDEDAKKKHRALNMLKLIYQQFSIKPKHNNPPTDEELSVFRGKLAGIKIGETEPNENGKQYNWVSEVHPSTGFVCKTGTSLVIEHKNSVPFESAISRYHHAKKEEEDLELDIPF